MTFTDDDLKRLKNKIPELNLGNPLVLERHQVIALLARIEAAEIICRRWNDDYYYEDGSWIMDWVYDDLKRWRKSCGKAGE